MVLKKGFCEWMSLDDMAVEAHLRRSERKSLRVREGEISETVPSLGAGP